jgi:hypothetical protein|tara:strand:+ start:524 stop:1828 length:1305 start_codon:yes stop_codon:yes gene_type:complete
MRELDEIFIRKEIQKILNEQTFDATWGDIVPPSGEQMYDTFIGPWVNIYKVAKVAFKDSADAILTTIQSAFTFAPEKQKVLMDKFRKRRDKYKGEMAGAMKGVNETLSSPDAQLVMFMMNPGVYMGAGMAREAADIAEPFTDYAVDKLGNVSKMMGIGSDYIPPAPAAKGPIGGLLGDLKSLFFGPDMSMTTGDLGQIGQGSPVAGIAGGAVRTESFDEIDELERILKEGDEEGSTGTPPDKEEVQTVVDDFLKTTGAGEKIEGYAKEMIDSKKAEAAEVKEQYVSMIEGLNQISQATSLEEMSSLIPKLSGAGIDLSTQAAEVEKLIQDQKDKISAGGDEAEEILSQLKETPTGKDIPDDASPEAWGPVVEQSVIAAAFADAVDEAKKQSVGGLIGFVAEMPRSDLEQIAAISPLGKEFAEVIFQLENDLLSV